MSENREGGEKKFLRLKMQLSECYHGGMFILDLDRLERTVERLLRI